MILDSVLYNHQTKRNNSAWQTRDTTTKTCITYSNNLRHASKYIIYIHYIYIYIINTRYINSTKGTSSKKDAQIVCEKHLQHQQDLCLWCFVHLITFIITQRTRFKDSRQTQQGILKKKNPWFRVLSLISFRLLDDTVLRGYCFDMTNTFKGQGLYKYPSFQTQAAITGLQASNHQYEISKKRQSIFLSRGEANVYQPATTWLKKTKKLVCTYCSLSPSPMSFDNFHLKRIIALPRKCLGKLKV